MRRTHQTVKAPTTAAAPRKMRDSEIWKGQYRFDGWYVTTLDRCSWLTQRTMRPEATCRLPSWAPEGLRLGQEPIPLRVTPFGPTAVAGLAKNPLPLSSVCPARLTIDSDTTQAPCGRCAPIWIRRGDAIVNGVRRVSGAIRCGRTHSVNATRRPTNIARVAPIAATTFRISAPAATPNANANAA